MEKKYKKTIILQEILNGNIFGFAIWNCRDLDNEATPTYDYFLCATISNKRIALQNLIFKHFVTLAIELNSFLSFLMFQNESLRHITQCGHLYFLANTSFSNEVNEEIQKFFWMHSQVNLIISLSLGVQLLFNLLI